MRNPRKAVPCADVAPGKNVDCGKLRWSAQSIDTEPENGSHIRSDRTAEVASTRRAMVLYTSVTTSKTKGVLFTHDMIVAQIGSLAQACGGRQTFPFRCFCLGIFSMATATRRPGPSEIGTARYPGPPAGTGYVVLAFFTNTGRLPLQPTVLHTAGFGMVFWQFWKRAASAC